MKTSGYMTRALRHSDPRFSRVLGKLGYSGRDMRPAIQEAQDDTLAGLREEYQRVIGKRPFHGWDADTIRAKIAEAMS